MPTPRCASQLTTKIMAGYRAHGKISTARASPHQDRLYRIRPPSRTALLLFAAATTLALCGFRLSYMWGFSSAIAMRARQSEVLKADMVFVEQGAGNGDGPEWNKEQQPRLPREEIHEERGGGGGGGGGGGYFEIKYVALIAERHTGSTWMTAFLTEYFSKSSVIVMATLCTWKHWFQDRIHEDIQVGKRRCHEDQACPACLDMEHTLVVAMWRNPYDWISGMYRFPHHAKAHFGLKSVTTFMTKRWMVEAQREKVEREKSLRKAELNGTCMDNFLPSEVVPCDPNDRAAIYEVDPEGEAYANIYELRKAKIKDFNAVETWAPNYEVLQYENVLDKTGLRDWLRFLETRYDLAGDWQNVPNPVLAKKLRSTLESMYYLSRHDLAGDWQNVPDPVLAKKLRSPRKSMYNLNSAHCSPKCLFSGHAASGAVETLHGMWDEELESSIGYHKIV